MKKLLVLIFSTFALVLTADNYQSLFNACIIDSRLEEADSILKVWSKATPDDPELYPARFNLFLNRAYNQMIVLSPESGQKEDELMFEDSTGNTAGYIYREQHWQDSLVDSAFNEIDRGLATYPDRLDFRLGKAAAAIWANRWQVAVEALDDLLKQDSVNHGRWFTTNNEPQNGADTIIVDGIFNCLREIYNSDSQTAIKSALPLTDKAAKRFEKDVQILNMAGGMNVAAGNADAALAYFEKASNIAPEDAIPLTNIAYINNQLGDTTKALKIYREILNGNFDDESKETAAQMIAQITAPVKDMEEYYYFFHFLPSLAAQTDRPDEFLDVEMNNSSIPAFNQLRSPFADSDIKVYDVPQKDDEAKAVVWTFPMPEEIPMCRYIAFVADGQSACKVFTLEKSFEENWVIGSKLNNAHSNFGDIPYTETAEDFVKALRKKGLLKKEGVAEPNIRTYMSTPTLSE